MVAGAHVLRKAGSRTRPPTNTTSLERLSGGGKEATAPFKQAEGAAKAYKGYARMFQTHIARIEVALRCKQDLNCYVGTLKLTPDESAKNLTPYIKDIKDWTKDEKVLLVEAERVRDRRAAHDPVRSDHRRHCRQRRHVDRRYSRPLDLLRQHCPAARARPSGPGQEHGLDS